MPLILAINSFLAAKLVCSMPVSYTHLQEEDYKQMVIVKDIDFFSLCEHHMLPFFGKAHVAYIPKKYITGLSKIPRVVDIFARRLQIQERMTMQIKDCIQRTLDPLGVMVVIEAQHMCMPVSYTHLVFVYGKRFPV